MCAGYSGGNAGSGGDTLSGGERQRLGLAGEYELKLTVGILTYGVSILLTFGTSLAVGWMVAGKNRKIDMVEALKGVE